MKPTLWITILLIVGGVGMAAVRLDPDGFGRLFVDDPLIDAGTATANRFDRFYRTMVVAQPPHARAELALSLALRGQLGATDYIIENAQGWRGTFGPSPSLDTLIGLGQSSPHIEVRMATFETYLAAYDLEKSEAQVDEQLRILADNPNTAPWVFHTLGMIGARGAARGRVFDELTFRMQHNEARMRSWAVTGLATLGGTEVIEPLLQTAASDPATAVRQNAFFALAVYGTLHLAERYEAVPGLLAIAADSAQDPTTRAWSIQVLREITEADFGEDPDAWRAGLADTGLLVVQ